MLKNCSFQLPKTICRDRIMTLQHIPVIPMPQPNQTIAYTEYLVGFYDILGQRELLSSTCLSLTNEHSHCELLEHAQNTLGVIYTFRSLFNTYFAGYLSATSEDMTDSSEAKPLENIIIKCQAFSDTIIVYLPLANSSRNIQWRAIHSLLAASTNIMPMLLSKGIPIRGAIELGIGTEFIDGELYGPVLQEAYRLESEVASYPRLIVGKYFASFFQDSLNKVASIDILNPNQLKALNQNINWFTIDDDGEFILNYLGESSRILPGSIKEEAISQSYKFVCQQLSKFSKENDLKLMKRYTRLKCYFDRNLSRDAS